MRTAKLDMALEAECLELEECPQSLRFQCSGLVTSFYSDNGWGNGKTCCNTLVIAMGNYLEKMDL